MLESPPSEAGEEQSVGCDQSGLTSTSWLVLRHRWEIPKDFRQFIRGLRHPSGWGRGCTEDGGRRQCRGERSRRAVKGADG
jgi:hypothetical protein